MREKERCNEKRERRKDRDIDKKKGGETRKKRVEVVGKIDKKLSFFLSSL